jgi:hypothetical protein
MSKTKKVPREHEDIPMAVDWDAIEDLNFAEDYDPLNDPMTPEEEEMEAQDYEAEAPLSPAGVAYISGPMRGKANFNYDLFNEVETQLVAHGWEVLNPTRHFDGDQTREPAEYMALDLEDVIKADAVFLLPGWQDSEGARLEYQAAKFLGKQFFYVNGASQAEPAEMEAASLVRSGKREAQYGHPGEDFRRTAGMWSGYLLSKLKPGESITPLDVALMMVHLKTSRLMGDPAHRDSLVDAHGYLTCFEKVLETLK